MLPGSFEAFLEELLKLSEPWGVQAAHDLNVVLHDTHINPSSAVDLSGM